MPRSKLVTVVQHMDVPDTGKESVEAIVTCNLADEFLNTHALMYCSL